MQHEDSNGAKTATGMDWSAFAERRVRCLVRYVHCTHFSALQARIDAVDEIMTNATYHMEKLRSLLVNMPDLVRGLTRVQYGKVRTIPQRRC